MIWGRLHWYDFIILALAALIIFPDQVLLWIAQTTGHTFYKWQAIVLEAVGIVLMIVAVKSLRPFCPGVDWEDALIYIGAVGGARVLLVCGQVVPLAV